MFDVLYCVCGRFSFSIFKDRLRSATVPSACLTSPLLWPIFMTCRCRLARTLFFFFLFMYQAPFSSQIGVHYGFYNVLFRFIHASFVQFVCL